MSTFIPENKVEEIKAAANMEDLARKYLTFKKSGKNLVCECPFHDGKSFNVDTTKNKFYKCYGCNKFGTAVSFVMDWKKITYPEALRFLAGEFNVIL